MTVLLEAFAFVEYGDRMQPRPYKSTTEFDELTLPQALQNEHRTKPGTWGLLRVLEGKVKLVFIDPRQEMWVTPDRPAVIPPQETHYVVIDGPMRLRVEFFHDPPFVSDD